MYQKVMQQVLQGCEWVHNIMDDIIVHASNQKEHVKCLENAVRVLRDKGITLNRGKCLKLCLFIFFIIFFLCFFNSQEFTFIN